MCTSSGSSVRCAAPKAGFTADCTVSRNTISVIVTQQISVLILTRNGQVEQRNSAPRLTVDECRLIRFEDVLHM